MAWLDDRIWAHPKITSVSLSARWAFVSSLAYSSGFGLYGHLNEGHLRALKVTPKARQELVEVGLWHERISSGIRDGIEINDWKEHNGRRDDKLEARRAADRERKRRERERKGQSVTGQSRDGHTPMSRDGHGAESRDAPRAPARARVGAPPMTDDGMTEDHPAARTSPQDDAAAGDLERLAAAGWTTGQLDAAAHDTTRAVAWLDHCAADPTCHTPGALSWEKWHGSQAWPEKPRPSVPTGAQGTRSTSPPLPDRPPAPDLERIAPPADFLTLAGRTPEPPAPPPGPPPVTLPPDPIIRTPAPPRKEPRA